MEENKLPKYGFYISILGLAIAFLALIRDYFDFKENPDELGNYFDKGAPILYISVGLITFIIGYLFHKISVFKTEESRAKMIINPKILIAYTDEKTFGNDENIITNSKQKV